MASQLQVPEQTSCAHIQSQDQAPETPKLRTLASVPSCSYCKMGLFSIWVLPQDTWSQRLEMLSTRGLWLSPPGFLNYKVWGLILAPLRVSLKGFQAPEPQRRGQGCCWACTAVRFSLCTIIFFCSFSGVLIPKVSQGTSITNKLCVLFCVQTNFWWEPFRIYSWGKSQCATLPEWRFLNNV